MRRLYGRMGPVALLVLALGWSLLVGDRARADCKVCEYGCSCPEKDKLSNGCCPAPKKKRVDPPPQTPVAVKATLADVQAMVAAQQYDAAVAAAFDLSLADRAVIARQLEVAARCAELKRVFALNAFAPPNEKQAQDNRVAECLAGVDTVAIDQLIVTGKLADAQAIVDSAPTRWTDPGRLAGRAAYLAAMNKDCALARTLLAQSRRTVEELAWVQYAETHCPDGGDSTEKDQKGGFVGVLVRNRFALGGRRSSRGLTVATTGGYSEVSHIDHSRFFVGGGLLAIRPGNDGSDGQLSSVYGLEGVLGLNTDDRRRVGFGILMTMDLAVGKYLQDPDDTRHAFVWDIGLALQFNLNLGGGLALRAYGGIRGGIAIGGGDGIGGAFHGVSGLDAGGALTWACCFK